jgi:hypothetical protein
MKGGTLTKIREGDIFSHMKEIFSTPTVIGRSGTSIIFKGEPSTMFEPNLLIMKVQYLGESYTRYKINEIDGVLFSISIPQYQKEIKTQIDADEAVLRQFGQSFIPSIVFSTEDTLDKFPFLFDFFEDKTSRYAVTFMETFQDAISFSDMIRTLGTIHFEEHPIVLKELIPLAIKEEKMLMQVGYKQNDSSYGNFLNVNGKVYMIDFGQVVICEPGPPVENPDEVFLKKGGKKKTKKRKVKRIKTKKIVNYV